MGNGVSYKAVCLLSIGQGIKVCISTMKQDYRKVRAYMDTMSRTRFNTQGHNL